MTAGFSFSSLVLLLRGEGWKENLKKMAVILLMQSVQCFEENFKPLFFKNVMASVLKTWRNRLQERRKRSSSFSYKEKGKKLQKKSNLNTKKLFHEV